MTDIELMLMVLPPVDKMDMEEVVKGFDDNGIQHIGEEVSLNEL